MTAPALTLTKLEHASVVLASDRARILVDPGNLGTPNDPGAFDAILLTHHHPDHAAPEFLRDALAAGVDVYGPADAGEELGLAGADRGGAHWHPVEAGETFSVGDVPVVVAGSIHAEIHPDVPGRRTGRSSWATASSSPATSTRCRPHPRACWSRP